MERGKLKLWEVVKIIDSDIYRLLNIHNFKKCKRLFKIFENKIFPLYNTMLLYNVCSIH